LNLQTLRSFTWSTLPPPPTHTRTHTLPLLQNGYKAPLAPTTESRLLLHLPCRSISNE
jgi:hypothetical protein